MCYNYIEGVNMAKITQVLHAYNSCLEVNNEDITKLKLEYEFGNYTTIYYKDGKKSKEEVKPCITFELRGKNKNQEDVWFEFEVRLGLDDLNKFKQKPIDISKSITFDGPSLQIGEEPYIFSNFRHNENNINDMYHILSSAYVFKKEKNIFIFKLFIPDDNLFTYFEVDFNERND